LAAPRRRPSLTILPQEMAVGSPKPRKERPASARM
jgi:hypothetical protein